MTPVEVRWGADVNRIKMFCDCGHTFWARVDRWFFRCPYCGKSGSIVKAQNDLVGFR